jgi:hypothetical protein
MNNPLNIMMPNFNDIGRKRSGSEKETVKLKSLSLDERKRLIKKSLQLKSQEQIRYKDGEEY